MVRILDILSQIRPATDFASSADFIGDGLLDSFDLIQLIHHLETEYGVCIPGEAIVPENFVNPGTIMAMVRGSMKAGTEEAV